MDNNNNLPSFRNLYAFNGKQPADLSLSENPLGCSFQAAKVLKNITRKDFSDYPDPDSINLIKIIKKRLGIRSGGIFAANGSEAIIKLIPPNLFTSGG